MKYKDKAILDIEAISNHLNVLKARITIENAPPERLLAEIDNIAIKVDKLFELITLESR